VVLTDPTVAKTFLVLHRETNVAQTMIASGAAGPLVDELLSQLWRLQGRLEKRASVAPDESREMLTELCHFTRSRLEATEQSLSFVSTLH
jgi:hypothetical protein